MRLATVAFALLAGCHAPEYRPPEWDPPPRAVVSTGCLELTAALMASGLGKVPGIPLTISFHSHCKEPALLDLRRVRVLARDEAGAWLALVPYDPSGEMRTGLLAPGDGGYEPIEYDAPPAGSALPSWDAVCANFDLVRPDVPPVSGAVLCFDREGRLLAVDGPPAARGGRS